jgi:hypothetical protein
MEVKANKRRDKEEGERAGDVGRGPRLKGKEEGREEDEKAGKRSSKAPPANDKYRYPWEM